MQPSDKFHRILIEKIRRNHVHFLETGEFVDLTLVASDGYEVAVHRPLIAAASTCLCERLKDNGFASTVTSKLTRLPVPELTGAQLTDIIDLIYRGRIRNKYDVKLYYLLAHKFGIELLLSATCQQMFSTIKFVRELDDVVLRDFVSLLTEAYSSSLLNMLCDLFALTPFLPAWLENLSWLSFDLFQSLLSGGSLFMLDKSLHMGRRYEQKAVELTDMVAKKANWSDESICQLKATLSNLQSVALKPPCLVPTVLTCFATQAYGTHQPLDDFGTIQSDRKYTFLNFPPDQWVISGFVCQIMNRWENRQPLETIVVQYRNIWTGERVFDRQIEGENRHWGDDPIREEVYLEDDETICAVDLNCGYLIDQITFITSRGRRLGPLGRSTGGSRFFIPAPSPSFPQQSLTRSSDFDTNYRDYLKESGLTVFPDNYDVPTVPFDECLGLTLHGFAYSSYWTQGYNAWNNVHLYFAGWPISLFQSNTVMDSDKMSAFLSVERLL